MAARSERFDALFYAPWIGPLLEPGPTRSTGGAETQILLLAQGLAARGHSICVVAVDTRRGLPAEVDGIALRVIPMEASKLRRGWALARALVRTRAGAVVQRSASNQTSLVGLITRLFGRRYVYSSSSVMDFDYAALEPKRRNVVLYHLGIRLARVLVVQTEEQVRLCRETFNREPVLIKSAAEPAAPGVEKPQAFLWIGRVAASKRPDELFALAAAVPEARFWFVAAGWAGFERTEARLRRRVAELENVEWLERMPRAELLDLIGSAVAIVSTSEYEGMPNIFLEGWARGIPALSLSADPDGVIEREGLGLFADGDRDRLAEQARLLWSDQEGLRGRIAERAVAYVRGDHALDGVLDRWEAALALSPGASVRT